MAGLVGNVGFGCGTSNIRSDDIGSGCLGMSLGCEFLAVGSCAEASG